jgi:hypothetical protein
MAEVKKEDSLDNRRLLEVERDRFHLATDFSIRVSVATQGQEAPLGGVLASYVFTRTCIEAETIEHLIKRGLERETPFTLDHFSIAVLSRTIIEAALMNCYLLETVTEQQWNLRRRILDLHDVLVKLRLFKGLRAKDQVTGFRGRAEELRSQISKNEEFKALQSDRREKILSGTELYVGGLRSVLKEIDFETQYFDAIYNYLSGQVHVSSNTFYHTHRGRLNFTEPAAYQLFVAAFGVAHARMFLLRAALKMLSGNSSSQKSFSKTELEKISRLSDKAFAADVN